MVVQTIDGVPFQMKEAYNFSFISRFGKVFRVFDQSSSGCICFGVEKDGKRYFLKFAGAHTVNDVLRNIEDTILRLKYSVPKYNEMKHPLLVNLIDSMEIGGGYLSVFDWFDGESCGYPQRETCKRFMALPAEKKMRVYDGILEFHAHVAKCGYVDIDFYAKQYYMNGYSGIWGAPLLLSPEEKRSGAVVDEVSNVYAMGATAFLFFSEDDKHSREKWALSDELYEVAKKAVSEQRNGRQQTISELIAQWNTAKMSSSQWKE